MLFAQNDPIKKIYWIHEGWVKLHKQVNASQCSILKLDGNQNFAGISDCWDGEHHQFGATTITPVEITEIDPVTFRSLLNDHHGLAGEVMTIMANEAMYYLDRLTSRHHKQLPGRVADMLLYFFDLFEQKPVFHFPLNRTELAQFAGTTRESLIRTLTEFKNDRIIRLEDRQVEILSLEIVQTLSRLG